jgi:hypothetical protein
VADQGVGQHDDARGEQAAVVQPAGLAGELQDGLGGGGLARVPLPQIEPVQEGLVRGEGAGGVDVIDVWLVSTMPIVNWSKVCTGTGSAGAPAAGDRTY